MNKLTLLLTLIVAIIAGGCSDKEETSGISTEFKVASSTISYVKDGGVKSLKIVAPSTPSVTSDAAWLHVGSVGLNGDSKSVYSVDITADANSGYDPRTATLTVSCEGASGKVSVSQSASDGLKISGGIPEGEVSAEGELLTLTVEATGAYTVSTENWMEVVGSRSLSSSEVKVEVLPNNGSDVREGRIVFALEGNPELSTEVVIRQSGGKVEDLTAKEMASRISLAVNIGNTLEAIGGETAWGAPKINSTYLAAVKSAGFDAVRLPVAWKNHADANLTIDADWMNRVEEVVQMCMDAGLITVMNIHWDEGWMESNIDRYDENVDRIQRTLWTQIAERFNHFDHRLIFAGANESGKDSQASAQALQKYMQTFVDVVRNSGGNNAIRVLAVQAPGTDINNGVKYSSYLPTDVVSDKLLYEIHYYDPSDFTIMSKDNEWGPNTPVKYFWGKDYHSGTKRDCTWGEEEWLAGQMAKLKSTFVDRGIPVIMGEFGCGRRTSFLESIDSELHSQSRAYYHRCIVREARNAGVVPFYWETPNTLFNRQGGEIVDRPTMDGMLQGVAESRYPY